MSKIKKSTCGVCKRKYEPRFNTKVVTATACSCACAVKWYEHIKSVTKGRVPRSVAKDVAKMVGRRSMAEVTFEANFIEGKPIDALYEAEVFEYPVQETRKYTPDWVIKRPQSNRKLLYIEYKGVLDKVSRKKMKLVKKAHPKLDIRIVFQNASNKIYRGSKTTYGKWADQHGFIWADNVLPPEWLR
jgi:hypothetical protein